MTLPAFQAQNPAISGYPYGWASCTAFSGAMAASYHQQVAKVVSGGGLRNWTGDFSGGLNLAQIDAALYQHLGIDLDVRYRYPWEDFLRRVASGQGAVLQGWYSPIANSRFDAGGGFRENHAFFVPPGLGVMDPLADGRRSGIYKYHGESYPPALLKDFAARLNIGGGSYRPLGNGLVYAAFTRSFVPRTYKAFLPNESFWVYTLSSGVIVSRKAYTRGGGSSVPCTGARLYRWPGHGSKSLVKVTKGIYEGRYVSSLYAREV